MKKYILITLLAAVSTSCNFLYHDEATGMTQENAYSYFDNLESLVVGVYDGISSHYSVMDGAMRESATDNSMYAWQSNEIYNIYEDVWSALNTLDEKWEDNYEYIRRASSFLELYDPALIERFEWDSNYADNLAQIEMSINEVHVLRAYFHFELAKRYGDIPLITRVYEASEINEVEKTPFADVIDYIVETMEEYGELLPANYTTFVGAQTGRVTLGMARALKARALLYKASPLFNTSDDNEIWGDAARAANTIIQSGTYYMPAIANDFLYSSSGADVVLSSPQLIFECRGGSSNSFEARNMPYGMEGALGGNTPSQNFVDAFEFLDGTTFDWNNPEHVAKMYTDADGNNTRDPRMYINVVTNGSEFMSQTVETFTGGLHNLSTDGYTKTGYYLRKLMNETVSLDPTNSVSKNHHYPLFRYAEVLLNYAEALYEYKGDYSYTDSEFTTSPLSAVNVVRTAAGMPSMVPTSNDDFVERLRNERRVELAFENHRFWDIRRWMIGDVVKDIYGVTITRQTDGSYSYEKSLVQTRIWKDKMYLYPIPDSELYVNPNLAPQNPSW